MPHLYTLHPAPDAELGLWRIEESSAALKALLRRAECYEGIVSGLRPESRREREVLAVRCLLAHMMGEEQTVLYDAEGAPRLADSERRISISHTDGYAAVLLSSRPAGVDIERIGKRVERVVSHFLTEAERDRLHDQVELHLAWSAKEAVYKVLGRNYFDLKHLVNVTSVRYDTDDVADWNRKGCLLLAADGRPPLEVGFRTTADFVLAWTLD